MAALTADIPTRRDGTPGNATQPVSLPVQAGAKCWGGSVATTYKGYALAPSTPSSDMLCWGLYQRTADHSAVGPRTVTSASRWRLATFWLYGGAGGDALTEANVGQPVYLIDEKTVGATNGSSSRPAAGTLKRIDSGRTAGDKYSVHIGTPAPGTANP